ncbi:hypothetical protein V8F44DRAFT_634429 [Aspergillus fumigatus]
MGELKALICGGRTADSIPEKSLKILKTPSVKGVEILRARCLPDRRIAYILGLGKRDDALGCMRWRNTPLTVAYLWTVGVIALETGMTVVPLKEFYKKEPPIALCPKVSIEADKLKIRAPWTISWHIMIFQTEEHCCFTYIDACIYGIGTDGHHWMFIRINNESRQQSSFDFNRKSLDEVYTILGTMVRHAMHLASQRVAASTTEKLPSSIRFLVSYKKTPPEPGIDTDTEYE